MEDQRANLTIVILENRQMIATILSDLLTGAGYATRLVQQIDQAEEILPECQPGMLLADLGMIRPDMEVPWQRLQEAAESCCIPVLTFSCSAVSNPDEDVLVLRSPSDFAMVVQRVETEHRKKQPFLGATLVQMGLIGTEELAAVLQVQQRLAQVGRDYDLGDLLVRLGFISAEDLAKALH